MLVGPVSRSNVTLQAGGAKTSPGIPTPSKSTIGRVVITPITSAYPTNGLVGRVLLKAVNKSSKKESKVFSIRCLDFIHTSCSKMKEAIRAQLPCDIIEGKFDIGFLQGNTVISIRNDQDITEVYNDIKRGIKVTLWCDGLKEPGTSSTHCSSSKKRKQPQYRDTSSSESDDSLLGKKRAKGRTKKESKDKQIEATIKELKDRHSMAFTQMQYRIWSEMLIGGIYSSYDEAPKSSMFSRAGGAVPKKSRESTESSHVSATTSPMKTIDGRSKCYKQLSDLQNLKTSGVLSEEEFRVEKNAIMVTLKKIT